MCVFSPKRRSKRWVFQKKKAGHPKELEDDAYYGNELEDPRNCGWFPCAATSPLP